MRSVIDGVAWPGVPDSRQLPQLAIQFQLEQTQWWSAERLRAHQFHQLAALVRHAATTVPFYRDLFRKLGFDPKQTLDVAGWQRLPVLTRRDLQDNFDALKSAPPPSRHGNIGALSSSGSTGTPVKVLKTGLQQQFWQAIALREHLWHRRDLSRRSALIRNPNRLNAGLYPEGSSSSSWSSATAPFATGPSSVLNLSTPVHLQAEWIQRVAPDYLMTYPSNLEALAHHCRDLAIGFPSIRELRTMSEVLRPEVRELCRDVFGLEIKELYSAEEVGHIALQSPIGEELLVQAETVLVEIIDEHDQPSAPGQVGRVIVTPLHAFAMPLIRYAIGDLAEAGGTASCGRGLPVITRVLGRLRNMVRLPDGQLHFPNYVGLMTGFGKVIQFQVVRKAVGLLEVRLVSRAPLDDVEEATLRQRIHERFRYPFAVRFAYVSDIPRAPSGKFLDYLSEVD